ncbi:Tripartite-type tricarboxylate transporter, receptor component TctC [Variovorax sp. HW608]|uniref:Bug family tripartite tricarboxylate transporter substrate binding protein n=1 Tax=Variovorax sp. HW608 TaxID=1034889 RepID=UPI00081FB084|nr:tripartite tricarboxylate transporter substrate binding protein [Variovorax sp. HW608]SCK35152.1 Tripartite-type tricarboxylate transporter, receptor component TctC [Variovorax sp. HW608]
MKRRTAIAAAMALCTLAPAWATEWPAKPITLVIPFPAGGSTDAVGRLLAQRLGERLGQAVVVDNRAGAGGNLGTEIVAKAAPDGYTLALSTSGPLANNKFLYKSLPFDPAKLAPVAAVGEIPILIAAHPGVKAANLKEFVEQARARPGKLSVAHPGNGTMGHLAVELVKSQARIDTLNVPYKGDTPAITDVLGGNVDALSLPLTAVVSHVQAGKLKGLAVTSRQRFAGLPEVPTALEQGIDVDATVWFAVVGPAGLPAAVVERLNKEINAILATPEARAKLAQFGANPLGGTAQQLAQLMSTDSAKWKKVIATAGITLD